MIDFMTGVSTGSLAFVGNRLINWSTKPESRSGLGDIQESGSVVRNV